MKQKDALLVATVAILSAMFAFAISRVFITAPKNRQVLVEVVEPITSEFIEPNTKYFNEKSIDPTKLITIGDNNNPKPFNGNK